ncbi:MAG: hypothetical protein FJZ15_03240 [Candidatus Omnitrophica bacterium]|nr:hypothetical protein [Candidatus Omnitrophota bacterium]
MDKEEENYMRVKWSDLILIWLGVWFVHLASLLMFFNVANACLPIILLQSVYTITGLTVFYFFPGFLLLLGIKKDKEVCFADFLSSVILSIIILVLNVNLIRILNIGITRWGLLGITTLISLIFYIYFCGLRHKNEFFLPASIKISLKRFVAVFVTLLLLTAVFALPLIKQANFVFDCRQEAILSLPTGAQTDLHEKVGMMRGLRSGFFPYWHLEHEDKFGFLAYELAPTYIYFINSVIFGDSFFIFYLYFFCCLLLASLIAWELAQGSFERIRNYGSGAIILAAMCGYYWLVLKYPNHIAISTHLWVFLLLAQIFALSVRAWPLFYCACALAFFTKEISLVFSWVLVITFAGIFLERKQAGNLYKRLGAVSGLLILFVLGFGIFTKNLPVMGKIFAWDYLGRYDYFGLLRGFFREGHTPLRPQTDLWNNVDFIAWVIGGSFFQAIFFFFPSKDKLTRWLTYSGLMYILAVLLSQFKLIHYAFFLILLSAPVCYRKIKGRGQAWAMVIALIFPLFVFAVRDRYDEYFFSRYSHMNRILFNNSFDFHREMEKMKHEHPVD